MELNGKAEKQRNLNGKAPKSGCGWVKLAELIDHIGHQNLCQNSTELNGTQRNSTGRLQRKLMKFIENIENIEKTVFRASELANFHLIWSLSGELCPSVCSILFHKLHPSASLFGRHVCHNLASNSRTQLTRNDPNLKKIGQF